jgi:hypothetical protein
MRKTITCKFNLRALVALKTEPEIKRVVTGMILRPSGKMYELAYGIETTWHQEVEIENFPEKNKTIKGFKK